jgi:hypothetical protein
MATKIKEVIVTKNAIDTLGSDLNKAVKAANSHKESEGVLEAFKVGFKKVKGLIILL